MTPKQARRILREMPRRDRRSTFAGIYKYTIDGGLNFYGIDRHGIPSLLDDMLKVNARHHPLDVAILEKLDRATSGDSLEERISPAHTTDWLKADG